MRQILFIYFLIISSIGIVNAQDLENLFEQANTFYIENEYEQAIQHYDSISKQGYESAELYYNIGNSYYKLDQLGKAVLYYERALLLSPKDEDIEYNLGLVRMHVVDKLETIPEFFLIRIGKSIQSIFMTDTWSVISIIAFIIGLLTFTIYFFNKNSGIGKSTFIISMLTLIIALMSFNYARKQKNFLTGHKTAIIMTPSVTIKGSPDKSGTSLFVLHEGTKVKIVDKVGEWFEIKLSDGNKGWIKNTELEKI